MDYKKMWEELKRNIISKKEYYHKGSWCSITESVTGEVICDEILELMNKGEKINGNL